MIVGFSKHGTGGSKGPIQYLTGTHSPDGTRRDPAPVVLRGDPALVGRLIDSLDFKHKYTSGVLSFAPGEIITDAMAERIMDGFERAAFAGLERDQYNILWVKHLHAYHVELNFLVPRVELSTGKSLNIAPPGKVSRELFDTFRSMINAEYALSEPTAPSRARDVSLPNHLARLHADATRKGKALDADIREVITEHVRRAVDAGHVKDRDGVEAFLTAQGFTLTRTKNNDYLSVLDPETGKRLRLRGGLYNRERFNPHERTAQQARYGVPDPERAAELADTLERLSAARAAYHQQRYGRPGDDLTRQRTPTGPEYPSRGEPIADYVQRTLGDAAILPRQDGTPPARSTQRRRQRQRMQQAAEAIAKGQHDIPGAGAFERLGAFGRTLSGARARTGAEFARLAAAGRTLDAAGERLSATGQSFAASLNTWLEKQWWERFYGEQEPER